MKKSRVFTPQKLERGTLAFKGLILLRRTIRAVRAA